jgi:hypothetical protein
MASLQAHCPARAIAQVSDSVAEIVEPILDLIAHLTRSAV